MITKGEAFLRLADLFVRVKAIPSNANYIFVKDIEKLDRDIEEFETQLALEIDNFMARRFERYFTLQQRKLRDESKIVGQLLGTWRNE